MTYRDIVPETNAVCKKHPKCYVDIYHNADNGCPYFDICQAHPDGSWAFETDILARYMELQTGKPHSRFYFTFGSDPGFPFQNTGTVNCAFWYSEEHWTGTPNEREYTEPAEVIA